MKLSDFTPNFLYKRNPEENDLGFGTKLTDDVERLLNPDGSFNVQREGRRILTPYEALVEMSWGQFFLVVLLFFVGVNLLFGLLFIWTGIENLSGITPGTFFENLANSFFFSVQTFTTVGYGSISPVGFWANLLASLCALVGLMSVALVTGLFFARFSKPKARILFSNKAIISPYRDTEFLSLQFRIVNQRNNHILDIRARMIMSYIEKKDGKSQRRFRALPLEREQIYFFPLNWTIVHIIDKQSPIYEKTLEDIQAMKAEFLILIEGYDETFASTVHTNSSYTCEELDWGMRFEPMYFPNAERGKTILELEKISATQIVADEAMRKLQQTAE